MYTSAVNIKLPNFCHPACNNQFVQPRTRTTYLLSTHKNEKVRKFVPSCHIGIFVPALALAAVKVAE